MVLHDHASTFNQERRLIWRAPPSFVNYAFLFNRYLVPPLLVLGFCCLSGFAGFSLTNNVRNLACLVESDPTDSWPQACWSVWIIESCFILISLAIGNGIVTNHVVQLWGGHKVITCSESDHAAGTDVHGYSPSSTSCGEDTSLLMQHHP